MLAAPPHMRLIGQTRCVDHRAIVVRVFISTLSPHFSFLPVQVNTALGRRTSEFLRRKLADTYVLSQQFFFANPIRGTTRLLVRVAALRLSHLLCIQIVPCLQPLHTQGDGNCLIHALSLGMWGVQDKHMRLKTALAAFLRPGSASAASLFEPWKRQMRANGKQDVEVGAITAQQQAELKLMSDETMADEWQDELRTAEAPDKWLGALHVSAMAQVLRRPILVHGPMSIDNGQAVTEFNYTRGVYLPFLHAPETCCRDPLVLWFAGRHFTVRVLPSVNHLQARILITTYIVFCRVPFFRRLWHSTTATRCRRFCRLPHAS